MKTQQLTEQNLATTTPVDRDAFVRKHEGLVRQTVDRLCGPTARSMGSYDDLVSAGMIGLLSALDGFDAGRGVAFSTYAAPRVRGAVLDELRRLDVVPRSVRRKGRVIGQAREAVRAREGGSASPGMVANELGISVATLHGWELDAAAGKVENLDTFAFDASANSAASVDAMDREVITPHDEIEREEEVEAVRAAISSLPEQERLVLILYYYEDLKLKEIGDLIGVSESRVSQIRTRALSRLRSNFDTVAA